MIPSGSRHQRPKRMLPRNRLIPKQHSMLSQINRRRRIDLTFRGIMADDEILW